MQGNFFCTSQVSAEQPAAEKYRQLINSGKFFLEYSSKIDFIDRNSKSAREAVENWETYGECQIACNNGEKISCARDNTTFSKKRVYAPSFLYKDGMLYQFKNKKKAIRYENAEVVNELKLPAFFSALLPNNPNVADILGGGIPNSTENSAWLESGTENIFGQNFSYDKYKVNFLDSNGNDINQNPNINLSSTFTFYYDSSGELKYVKQEGLSAKMTAFDSFGKTYISIDKFTSEIPSGIFDFPKGCKVYRANTGTLNDLLGNEELVEKY